MSHKLKKNKDGKYEFGVYIGRFQVFHEGHLSVKNFIEDSGKSPVLIVGTSPVVKRLLTKSITRDLLRIEFNNENTIVSMISDRGSNLDWARSVINTAYNQIENQLNIKFEDVDLTIYVHEKEEDKKIYELEFGKISERDSYACVFDYLNKNFTNININVKRISFQDHNISGTQVRSAFNELISQGRMVEAKELISKAFKNTEAREMLKRYLNL